MRGSETQASALEQRIAMLEDRAAIAELRARFCILADERRWAELAELFTEDGVFDVRGPVTGRAAILASVRGLEEVWDAWWHFTDTQTLEITGDSARGVAYFDAPFVAEGVSFTSMGRYDDEFARVDGGWLIARRALSFAWSAPVAEGWTSPLPEGLRPASR